MSYNYLFKYIIIGEPSVGKSAILLKFTDDKFLERYDMTIGVEYGAKYINVDNKKIKIQIWDTAGQEMFKSISRSYYRSTAVALLVYDITNRKTFENLEKWLEEIREFTGSDIVIVLVGNKIDLLEERQVSYEEGDKFAKKYDLIFLETSAKSSSNISEVFYLPAEKIYNNLMDEQYDLRLDSTGIKVGIKELEIELDKNICDKDNFGCKC